ncbi:K+/H+ antiporter subunit F [Pseudoroseomonas rhizosphaerae]|uniref:K+/H+ antiporter subunit F n=1 Tax=Teichococcus rhizosphaerae TaxID=1335062 RepID=A0A2C7A859_9PROT|nr:K+/H+ antiporter subunit F [Pseudoroseomonas rhizosphaerae]PHK94189.1 K+/H+ antiporter subunit F [Pseudoroseomonas rhizosphaerae]
MSLAVLSWSLLIAQVMLALAFGCTAWRVLHGPRAQDRVVALDILYLNGMLLLLTFGIRTGTDLYFEAALVVALLGFVSTGAFAKFLMRGEVIE